MNWSLTTKTFVAGLSTLALFIVIGIISLHQASESKKLAIWVSHSHNVLKILSSCRSLAQESEEESRSYEETGDPKLLAEYHSHAIVLANQCSDLERRVSDNPGQLSRARNLSRLCQTEIKECDQAIEISPKKIKSKIPSTIESERAVEDALTQLEVKEKQLLAARSQHFLDVSNNILIGQVALLGFSLLMLVISYLMVRRHLYELKISEGLLKENQVRLDAILQSLAEGLYQVDVDGRLVFLNDAGAGMLGYESEEIVGQLMHDIIHDKELPAEDCPILSVVKQGGTQNREDMFRKKDGSLLPVQLLSAPLIVDGAIKGAVVSFYDITARKESQSNSNMQFALRNIFAQGDSLSTVAPKLLQHLCEFLDWDAGAMWLVADDQKSLKLINFWHLPDWETTLNSSFLRRKILGEGEDFAGKVWQRNASIWLGKGAKIDGMFSDDAQKQGLNNVFGFPIRSDEKVLGVIALLSNKVDEPTASELQAINSIASQCGLFIERNKTEDELRDREMLFQQLVNNIREIFWIISVEPGENKILYVSPAFEEVWGRPLSDVYQRANSYLEAIVEEDRERMRQYLLNSMYTASSVEFRIKRPDGSIRWLWGRWSPVIGNDGKPKRLVGIVHDITERKEMEKRVSEFYSTVSHELRTPLTSIRASLGLLEGGLAGTLSEKATKLVSIARSESDRLIRLINDILDIRKIEAGRLELKLKPVTVAKIVELTLQGTAGMANEFGVKLRSQISCKRQTLVDQDRLIQVLTNLVSNAIKFSPVGSSVLVRVEELDKFCRFNVVDDGPGIAADQLPKLFGLFQQLDSTDSRPRGGTGLGLAISKAIVEQHGGSIGVETAVGKGATFYFQVPIALEPNQSVAALEKTGSPTDFILLVEDDEKLTSVLTELLETEHYNVITARTIAEADEKIRQAPPRAIILDVHLPDGNGLDWMRRVSETVDGAQVPVVVLTGQETDSSYGLPLLVEWLRKPAGTDQLLSALKIALQRNCPIRGARVLIVEDDDSTREILVHQLNQVGIAAMEAASGMKALEMVQDHEPDLIILDLGLPGFDGFEFVRKLETSSLKAIPLIVYTSRDLSIADMDRLKLGITRHLIKSKTSQAEFLSAVRELLSNVLLPTN